MKGVIDNLFFIHVKYTVLLKENTALEARRGLGSRAVGECGICFPGRREISIEIIWGKLHKKCQLGSVGWHFLSQNFIYIKT
jgi:hypothetical protein